MWPTQVYTVIQRIHIISLSKHVISVLEMGICSTINHNQIISTMLYKV